MFLQKSNFSESFDTSYQVRLTKLTNLEIKKYALPGCRQKKWCSIDEFVFCKADGNYTKVYLSNGTNMLISKTMSEVIAIFPDKYLVRPHHSYVLNITHIITIEDKTIVVSGEKSIPISRRKRKEILEQIASI